MLTQRLITQCVLTLLLAGWASAAQCTFLGVNNLTQGNWIGVYGKLGYTMVDGRTGQPPQALTSLPAGASVQIEGTLGFGMPHEWEITDPNDTRALQLPNDPARRTVGTWAHGQRQNFSVLITTDQMMAVSMYCFWPGNIIPQTMTVCEAATDRVLWQHTVPAMGISPNYLRLLVNGAVRIYLQATPGNFACLSGIFFDTPPTGVQLAFPYSAGSIVCGDIYNPRGQLVRELFTDMTLDPNYAGNYSIFWDGLDQVGQRAPYGSYTFKLASYHADDYLCKNMIGYTHTGSDNRDFAGHTPAWLVGVAVDGGNHIYTANGWDEAGADFKVWDTNGVPLYDAHTAMRNGTPNCTPYAVAVDDKYMYFATSSHTDGSQMVQKFQQGGNSREFFTKYPKPTNGITLVADYKQAIAELQPPPATEDLPLLQAPLKGMIVRGHELWVADNLNKKLHCYDKTSGALLKEFPCRLVAGLAVDRANRLLAAHGHTQVSIIDTDTGQMAPLITAIGEVAAIAISPTTGNLYVADSVAHQVKIYQIAGNTATLRGTFGVPAAIGDRAADHFYTLQGVSVGADGHMVTIQNEPGMGARLAKWNADHTLQWEQFGLEFCTNGVFGANDPNTVYSTSFHQYQLDKKGGTWSYQGNWLPTDERRYLGPGYGGPSRLLTFAGKQFWYMLTGDGAQIYRKDAAGFHLAALVGGSFPAWDGTMYRADDAAHWCRWTWHDEQGDHTPKASEVLWDKPYGGITSVRSALIPAYDGSLTFADLYQPSKIFVLPMRDLDSRGNPVYNWEDLQTRSCDSQYASIKFTPRMVLKATDGSFYAMGNCNRWPKPKNDPFWMGSMALACLRPDMTTKWLVALPRECTGMDVVPGTNAGVICGAGDATCLFQYNGDGMLVSQLYPGPAVGGFSCWLDQNGSVCVNRDPNDNLVDVFVEDSALPRFIWYRANDALPVITAQHFTYSNEGQAAAPAFTPAAGEYGPAETVTMTSATNGATIRYTTNGSDPSGTVGTLYRGPVSISGNTLLKAIAYMPGMQDSIIATAAYTIGGEVKWTGKVIGTTGSYNNDPVCTKEKAFDGDLATFFCGPVAYDNWCGLDLGTSRIIGKIRYVPVFRWEQRMVGGKFQGSNTADFNNPVDLYTITTAPSYNWNTVTIANSTPFRYVRYVSPATGFGNVSEIEFYGHPPNSQLAAPTYSPCASSYTCAQCVTMTSAISGATIRYTTDGSVPTATLGTLYTAPVPIRANTTLKAVACMHGMTDSNIATGTYSIQCAIPTFTPVADTYAGEKSVTIRCSTDGASIRYTTDGSTPSATVGVSYTTPLQIRANTDLQAIAYKHGMADSTIASGAFYLQCATPTITPATSTLDPTRPVTIVCATNGADIRYTTDGSTPTATTGTHYEGPVTITTTGPLRAIAYKSGMADSNLATGEYTAFSDGSGTGKLSGKVIGTSGSYNNDSRWTIDNVFDGDTATFFAGPTSEDNWCGLDCGRSNILSAIRYFPRAGYEKLMVGGKFQGSTTADFSLGVVELATVTVTPPNEWTTIAIANSTPFRYVRYLSPSRSYGNISEIEFCSKAAAPTFTPAGGATLSVTMSTTTRGAIIRYTTDGATPSRTVGAIYRGPIRINATTTLKAIAYLNGMANSDVTAGTFSVVKQ